MRLVLITALPLLAASSILDSNEEQCGERTFRNELGTCESCFNICDDCSGFTNGCSQCREKCPGYLDTGEPTTSSETFTTRVSTSSMRTSPYMDRNADVGTSTTSTSTSDEAEPGPIFWIICVAIVVIAVVLVIAFAIAIVYLVYRLVKWRKKKENEKNKKIKIERQMSNASSEISDLKESLIKNDDDMNQDMNDITSSLQNLSDAQGHLRELEKTKKERRVSYEQGLNTIQKSLNNVKETVMSAKKSCNCIEQIEIAQQQIRDLERELRDTNQNLQEALKRILALEGERNERERKPSQSSLTVMQKLEEQDENLKVLPGMLETLNELKKLIGPVKMREKKRNFKGFVAGGVEEAEGSTPADPKIRASGTERDASYQPADDTLQNEESKPLVEGTSADFRINPQGQYALAVLNTDVVVDINHANESVSYRASAPPGKS